MASFQVSGNDDVTCRCWDLFNSLSSDHFLSRLLDEELLSDRLFSCLMAAPPLRWSRDWSQVSQLTDGWLGVLEISAVNSV